MRCFIHPNKESTATCTKCGKAMCVDCSSFSNHTGICPSCKKTDMDKEVAGLVRLNAERTRALKTRLILSVIFFFLILPPVLYPAHKRKVNKEIALTEEKIKNIQKSLRFVDEALKRGSGDLSVASTTEEAEDIENSWQCPYCRTINSNTRVCKFCARKQP